VKVLVQGIILAAVLSGIGFAIVRAFRELSQNPIDWRQLDLWRLIGAVVCYSGTLLISGTYWRTVLSRYEHRLPPLAALRAFVHSQMGKYIPGKAMVIVIRTTLLRRWEVPIGLAVISAFIETLLWMFTGAQIACAIVLFQTGLDSRLRLLAGIMLLASGVATLPPVFNGVVRRISRLRKRQTATLKTNTEPLSWEGYFVGIIWLTVGWLVAGCSAWLVATSVPLTPLNGSHYLIVLAAVCLATVGGFVSLLPGGIGVRELVMIPLLAPITGVAIALITAILIRFCWMIAEIATSATIELLFRLQNRFVNAT
jgi:hypothetical protein